MEIINWINYFSNYNFEDWFNLIGSIIAFFLLILQIINYFKKRVNLSIKIKQEEFSSFQDSHDNTFETYVIIKADIRNKGLEPTTIAKVEFISDDNLFTNIEMTNNKNLEEIRIEPNDRIILKFTAFAYMDLKETNDINAKIIFKTSHKDIIKNIKIIKKG